MKTQKNLVSWCILVAFIFFFAWATFVRAAEITIYPTITNSHGGTMFAKDISVCWNVDGAQSCATGVPSFSVPTGASYSVLPTPPSGYAAVLDITPGQDHCSGVLTTLDGDGPFTCGVSYTDGAPILPPAPVVLPAPVIASPSIGSIGPIAVPVAPEPVLASSTLSEAEQIQILQAQIIELYKILIALLTQKLAVLK